MLVLVRAMRQPNDLSVATLVAALLTLPGCSGGPAGATTVALGEPTKGDAIASRAPKGDASLACGAATCAVPAEVCCLGSTPRCVPTPAPRGEGPLEELSALSEACSAGDHPFESVARCDDSGDCPTGTRCCEQFVASGADSWAACSASCDIHELCVAGRPCAKPGSACVDGVCAMPLERRRCNGATCPAAKPYCCGPRDGEVACATREACEADDVRRVECASPRDCVEGVCQRNVMGDATCTLLVDVANAALVCEGDADCDATICMGSPGKGKCDMEEKSCVCEAP